MKPRPIHSLSHLFWLLCALIVALAGCGKPTVQPDVSNPATETPPNGLYWPTEGWRTTSPEAQDMDSGKLAEMLASVQQQKLNLHSLLVIRHGYLVSETYFQGDLNTRHELYSCTKSFTSTLIGIALDQGKIDGLDHKIVDFFPGYEFENLDAHKQAMTLEDLLTMRSGLDWHEGDAAYTALYRSPDWVQSMLDMPMALESGVMFNYCSGCTHLLSAIVQRTTGLNTLDYAKQNLFKPLGITNVRWDTDSQGIPIGGWGLQITSRDMAKLGYLFLHQGEWDGQQVVSSGWVDKATQKYSDTGDGRGYGYQWWTYPSLDAFMATGRYGQLIFVIPNLDLVIVTTAQVDDFEPLFQLIEQYIAPAVQE